MPDERREESLVAVHEGGSVQSRLFRPPPPPFHEGVVADAMRRGLITCPPDTPLRVLAQMMASHGVRCLVVRDESGPRGPWTVVSDVDVAGAAAEGRSAVASDLGTTGVATIGPDAPLAEAARLMSAERVDSLLVVDPGSGRPVGAISSLDLVRAVAGAEL
ncbi:MAG: CBS domain-containing protein [Thermoleophilaceae bacterium]|nr:CBS domain-containing protein [Thermoleophilaceae bacterium]